MSREECIEVYRLLELEDTGDLQVIRAIINNIFTKRGVRLVEQTLVDIEFDEVDSKEGNEEEKPILHVK